MAEISVDFGRVVLALKEVFLEGEGIYRSYALPNAVASKLGIEDDWRNPHNGIERKACDRFNGQVARAGERLDTDGVVIKVGKGKAGPAGQRYNDVTYFLPAAYQAEAERIKDHAAAVAAERRAWVDVRDRLNAAGYPVTVLQSQLAPQLDLAVWQRMLRSLEDYHGIDRPKRRPFPATGYRWQAQNGEVVTASPKWICVWQPGMIGTTEGMLAGPWRCPDLVRTPDELGAWYEAWVLEGRPA